MDLGYSTQWSFENISQFFDVIAFLAPTLVRRSVSIKYFQIFTLSLELFLAFHIRGGSQKMTAEVVHTWLWAQETFGPSFIITINLTPVEVKLSENLKLWLTHSLNISGSVLQMQSYWERTIPTIQAWGQRVLVSVLPIQCNMPYKCLMDTYHKEMDQGPRYIPFCQMYLIDLRIPYVHAIAETIYWTCYMVISQ